MLPTCIITGAAGGIGQALMKGFHEAEYHVIGLDRVKRPADFPETMDYYQVDFRDQEAIIATFNEIEALNLRVTVLINNAAVAHFHEPLTNISLIELNQLLQVNLNAVILCSQQFLRLTQSSDYGRIINIASTRWQQNEPNWELYGASKGGLVSFTQSLAVSLRKRPITVNAISPGWIHCGPERELRPSDHHQHPSGRVGLPADIVRAALFLSARDNDFINGHNLVVDGGMSKVMHYE